MPKKKSLEQHYAKYDRDCNARMAEHNRAGGNVAKPVRSLAGATDEEKYRRAKFLHRKAHQALVNNHPLTDKNGLPTPAAMQFKRWAHPIPKTRDDLVKIRTKAAKLKVVLAARLGKK